MGTVCGCGNKRPLQKEERERIKAFTASHDTRHIILQLDTFKQDVKKISTPSIISYLDIFFNILSSKANTYQQKLHVILLLDSALSNNSATVTLFKKHPIQKWLIKEISGRLHMEHVVRYSREKKYNWQERFDSAVLELFENCAKNFLDLLPEIQNFCHAHAALFPRSSSYLKLNSETLKNIDGQLTDMLNRCQINRESAVEEITEKFNHFREITPVGPITEIYNQSVEEMLTKAPTNIDINVLELLNLEEKQKRLVKELNFQQDLMHILHNSSPDYAEDFEHNLRQHIANNFPNMLDAFDKNRQNNVHANYDNAINYHQERDRPQVYAEDQLDVPYFEHMINGQPVLSTPIEQVVDEKPPKMENITSNTNKSGQRNGKSRDKRGRSLIREKYQRNDDIVGNMSKKLGKSKKVIVGESFDDEKLTLLRKENQELNASIAQLEQERGQMDERIKRYAQTPVAKSARKKTTEMTFMKDFDVKNFTNPSNVDLLRILNEKEIALSRLQKSLQILERSYSEMNDTDENETSINNINLNFGNQLNTSHSLSKSFYQMNLVDLQNLEFKKKAQSEKPRDSFLGEVRADISRILNKRKDLLIE
jgi:hypothetical protein